MTRSKKPHETPDALLDAASKDAKITNRELSEEELKSVSGGGAKAADPVHKHVANVKWSNQ
jgi:bacteriocin-like protein